MPPLVVGGQAFLIRTIVREGTFTAYALRVETGDRFGSNFSGATEAEAVAGVTRWLEWQRDHSAALDALQRAERIYHRSVADHAFAPRGEDDARLRARRESLELVESARARLDAVRAGCPSEEGVT
jgi:hypothetical protein